MTLIFRLSLIPVLLGLCASRTDFHSGYFARITRGVKSNITVDLTKSPKVFPERWFTQYLDHFNAYDTRTWKQRYIVNDEHYANDGPVFLVIDGESAIDPAILKRGFVNDLAKTFKALCILLEHRYYGKSLPFPIIQSPDQLSYLSSEQALADTANFISRMRSWPNITSNSSCIVFGSSYAGSLAAWMRLKYPHLVQGAISQSSPLLAKVDFAEFYQVIESALGRTSRACLDAASAAFRKLYVMLREPTGRRRLQNLFNLCEPIEPRKLTVELMSLYRWLLSVLIYPASNRDLRLTEACELLTDSSHDNEPLLGLAVLSGYDLKRSRRKCFQTKSTFDRDSWALGHFRHALDAELASDAAHLKAAVNIFWVYQTCTEFGWYQTTGRKPFGIFSETVAVSRYVDNCVETFGPSFQQTLDLGVERTNLIYGGLDIANVTSNTAFVHGNQDPWFSVGVTESTNPRVSVIIIEGAGHCPLVLSPSKDENNQIGKAITKLTSLISSWLKK